MFSLSLSQVVSLVIKRPPHFAFKPGDYIFINIPAIATFEWHPYTISSAPEQGSHSLRDHNWKFLSNIGIRKKNFHHEKRHKMVDQNIQDCDRVTPRPTS